MYYGPTEPRSQNSGLLAYCGANVLRPHRAMFPKLGALSLLRGECTTAPQTTFPKLGALSLVRGECIGKRTVEEVERGEARRAGAKRGRRRRGTRRSMLTIKKQNLTQGVRKNVEQLRFSNICRYGAAFGTYLKNGFYPKSHPYK